MQCPQCNRQMKWQPGGPWINAEKRGPRVGEKTTYSERPPSDRQIWYCAECKCRVEETSQGLRILPSGS